MKTGKACAIFYNIESDEFTDIEKGEAIREVLDMTTHNGITKDTMLKVIKYLFDMVFEEVSADKKQTNAERIRNMTDEELAKIITCQQEIEVCICCPESNCTECTLKWLQSPVEV